MTRTEEYGFSYEIHNTEKHGAIPVVICSKTSEGFSINPQLAVFFGDLGTKRIPILIQDLEELNEQAVNEEQLTTEHIDGSHNEVAEISFNPSTITFNSASDDLSMPVDHFIELLNEWLTFLNSISFNHRLIDK